MVSTTDGTAIFSADDGLPLVVAGGEIALVDSEGVVVDGVRYLFDGWSDGVPLRVTARARTGLQG